MQIELTKEEAQLIAFTTVCRLEDYEAEIKKDEKRTGTRNEGARAQHSQVTRIIYTKFIPDSLSGDLKLMDGTTLTKK